MKRMFNRDKLKDEYRNLSAKKLAKICSKSKDCPMKHGCPFGNSILHTAISCNEIEDFHWIIELG